MEKCEFELDDRNLQFLFHVRYVFIKKYLTKFKVKNFYLQILSQNLPK